MGNSKSSLRRDLLFLDAADRIPARTAVAEVHADIAAAEVEVDGIIADRPRQPIVTIATSIVGTAVNAATVASSREKNLRCILEIGIITRKITTILTSYCYPR
jgi:hypothetical protein